MTVKKKHFIYRQKTTTTHLYHNMNAKNLLPYKMRVDGVSIFILNFCYFIYS